MNRRLIPIAIVSLVVFGGAAWYATGRLTEPDGDTLYGNIDIRQVDLAFVVDGRIAEVLVDEGDTVSEGDVVARLDDTPYRYAVAQAEASLRQSEANLAKFETGSRAEDIQAARARVAEANARLANAQATLKRRQSLVKDDAVSRQALDDAERDVTVAAATVSSRRSELKLAEEGFRSEDIDSARAAVAMARAALDQTQYRLNQTTIEAPAPGTILTRAREPGAVVVGGAPLLTLALARPVWVRTYVAEPYLGRVAPGKQVTVTTDDPEGRTYQGTVGFVSPTAEFTPKAVETPELRTDLVYRVRIVVDTPDDGLRQGMPVTITLNQ